MDPQVPAYDFVTSTYTGGNGGNCVEVARNVPGTTAVRDSKHQDGPVLEFTDGEWDAFVKGVRDGQFS